jgi:hypothetical protein
MLFAGALAEMLGARSRLSMSWKRSTTDGNDLIAPGLYLDLAEWHHNVFRLEPI